MYDISRLAMAIPRELLPLDDRDFGGVSSLPLMRVRRADGKKGDRVLRPGKAWTNELRMDSVPSGYAPVDDWDSESASDLPRIERDLESQAVFPIAFDSVPIHINLLWL